MTRRQSCCSPFPEFLQRPKRDVLQKSARVPRAANAANTKSSASSEPLESVSRISCQVTPVFKTSSTQ
jgi:hypothetical protein